MPRRGIFQDPNRSPHRGKALKVWLADHDHTVTELADWIGVLPTRITQWIYHDMILPPGFNFVLKYMLLRDRRNRSNKRRDRLRRQRQSNKAFIEKRRRLQQDHVTPDDEKHYL